jgi:hypothetical protein
MQTSEAHGRDYDTLGKRVPCWDRDCPGTIVIHRDPRKCVCSVCRRPLPNSGAITKSLILVAVLLFLTLAFVITVVLVVARNRV